MFGAFGANTGGGFAGFGANGAAQTAGFGQQPAANTGFGGFGQTAAPAANTGFGGFGQTAPPAANTGFGGFGQTAAPAANTGFGGFGQTAAPAANTGFGGFGQQQQQQPAANTGFGGFGQQQQQQQQPAANTGFGGFGQTNTANNAAGFGGFGQTNTNNNNNAFGNNNNNNNAFGNNNNNNNQNNNNVQLPPDSSNRPRKTTLAVNFTPFWTADKKARYANIQFDQKFRSQTWIQLHYHDWMARKMQQGGQQQQQPQQQNTFAQTTAPATNTGFGGFGQTAAPVANTGFGGFGQQQQQPAANTGFGGFGQTAPPAANTGFGGFGQTTAPAANTGFGGFGQTAAPAANTGFGGFGQQQQQQPAANTGFGGFGQTAAPAANTGFAFGQQQQQQPAANTGFGFGQQQPAANTGFGGFGQQQQQQPAAAGFGFGQPAQLPALTASVPAVAPVTVQVPVPQQPQQEIVLPSGPFIDCRGQIIGEDGKTLLTTLNPFTGNRPPATAAAVPAPTTAAPAVGGFSFGTTAPAAPATTAVANTAAPTSKTPLKTLNTPRKAFQLSSTGKLITSNNTRSTTIPALKASTTGLTTSNTAQFQNSTLLSTPGFSTKSRLQTNLNTTASTPYNPRLNTTVTTRGPGSLNLTAMNNTFALNSTALNSTLMNQTRTAPNNRNNVTPNKLQSAYDLSHTNQGDITALLSPVHGNHHHSTPSYTHTPMPKSSTQNNFIQNQNGWDYSDSEDEYDPNYTMSKNSGNLDSIDQTIDNVFNKSSFAHDQSLLLQNPSPHRDEMETDEPTSCGDDEEEEDQDTAMIIVDSHPNTQNNNHTSNLDPVIYPINSNPDLVISPSIDEMKNFTEEQLAQLDGLRIDHPTIGYVQWLSPVDVRYIDFGVSVLFDSSGIELYPQYDNNEDDDDESQQAPGPGEGINGPAQIALFNCFPTKALGANANDEFMPISSQVTVCSNGKSYLTSKLDQLEKNLRSSLAETGGEFISYDRVAGIWSFVVGSF